MNTSRLSRLLATLTFAVMPMFAWVSPAHAILGIGDIVFQPPTLEQIQEMESKSALYQQHMAELRLELHKAKYQYLTVVMEDTPGIRFFFPEKSRLEIVNTIDDYMKESSSFGEQVPQRLIAYRQTLSQQTLYISMSGLLFAVLVLCVISVFAGISLGSRQRRASDT